MLRTDDVKRNKEHSISKERGEENNEEEKDIEGRHELEEYTREDIVVRKEEHTWRKRGKRQKYW